MEQPLIPKDEDKRIDCLHSLNILDTASEERFDRLTRLAQRIFDVPIALVSLVDTNRQWFKSCMGLDASETGRDISFCGHAILDDQVFVINNALQDPRFTDNPLVTDAPHIRFYAGCPLRDVGGQRLGTLCLIDTKPRDFSHDDVIALKDLAAMAEQELAAVQLATTDELTEISNRRGFIILAEKALSWCCRNAQEASLLFMDLDGFKEINDSLGHGVGDQILKAFSAELQNNFRSSDVIGRIGGDEFVLFLMGSNLQESDLYIQRLRDALKGLYLQGKLPCEVSFSVGSIPVDYCNPGSLEQLLAGSDKLMYQEKVKARSSAS